ncbi:MAG: SGNH/GDSL hydrolase family protein [Parabacteroides sp.]|nr:SGNH/GDSL hydrolase family protein [Parabacteroides sp.]
MNTLRFHVILFSLLLAFAPLYARYKWENPLAQPFPVVRGQAWQDELNGTYVRLPQRAHGSVRGPVWDLSRQSAGLSVVFRSDAPAIKVRYTVTGGFAMPHMPATGVSGVDLYATDANGRSRWCAGKYAFGDTVTYTYDGLTYATERAKGYEYRLFLPLYNTVSWLEIGVPDSASFRFLPVSREKPLVIYGTSIAQGACASRPGMAWGNILNRKLEHPVINLGFSGNGRLESELFDLLAEIDARLYIIDCLPNLSGKERAAVIYDRAVAGIKKLRTRTQAPVLLVEHSGYTNEFSSAGAEESYRVANRELRKAWQALTDEGVPGVYYLTKEEIGLSMDAMVEGVHPSDLGMQQYANSYIRKIREILCEEGDTVFVPCKQQRDSFYDWDGRHEEILRLNATDAPEIVAIGNSITHFWGAEQDTASLRGQASWKKLFAGKKARNLGFGWDRIENVLWRIYHGELDGYRAKHVFLLIGTNNLAVHTNDEIVEGICLVAKAIEVRQPQAKLCVSGILPRQGMEARIRQINAGLQKRLGEAVGVTYIDFAPQLTDGNGLIIPSLFIDGLHPNREGYGRMAQVLACYQ